MPTSGPWPTCIRWGGALLPADGSSAVPGGSVLALSPDGRLVATAGPGFEVRLYSVEGDDTPVVLGTLDTI